MKFINSLTNALFKKYLLTTNIVTSGLLMQVGDLLSQKIEHNVANKNRSAAEQQPHQYDWSRNAKMFLVGAVQGPMHHYFYGWLDKKYAGATVKITCIKILYDQLVLSPLCIVAFFYPAGWLFDQTTEQCTKELKSKFIKVYIADWTVWPASQFINFYYLRPQYRVIYVNFITMLYNVFLSHVKHEDSHHSIAKPTTTQ